MSSLSSNLTLIPHVVIHPDKIIFYKEVHWYPVKQSCKIQDLDSEENQELAQSFIKSQRKNNGYLSTHAKRKLFRALDYMLITSNRRTIYSKIQRKKISYRIVFVTLTLPSVQLHSDKVITNKLLNQFFIELQKYHGVKRYIWRAEKQLNGDIHYHIVINEFIEYQELRKRWNRICNKLGYVDAYQKKMKEFFKDGFRLSENPHDKRSIEQQRKAFIIGQRSDWRSPNSTDIHDTRKIKDLKAYIGKYMSKNPQINIDDIQEDDDRLIVKGRLWSCSQDLSKIEGCNLIEDWQISDELEKVAANSKSRFYHDVYFSVLFINASNLKKMGSDLLFNYFYDYLLQKFKFKLAS